jgi:hypothetical protein
LIERNKREELEKLEKAEQAAIKSGATLAPDASVSTGGAADPSVTTGGETPAGGTDLPKGNPPGDNPPLRNR